MNTYRVDRANTLRTPCGMNSILYIGDDIVAAREAFAKARTGLDAWGQPNPDYGVLMSRWSNNLQDYVILQRKGRMK